MAEETKNMGVALELNWQYTAALSLGHLNEVGDVSFGKLFVHHLGILIGQTMMQKYFSHDEEMHSLYLDNLEVIVCQRCAIQPSETIRLKEQVETQCSELHARKYPCEYRLVI
jgi:hypothetical protein